MVDVTNACLTDYDLDDYSILDDGTTFQIDDPHEHSVRCISTWFGLPEWLEAQIIETNDNLALWTTEAVDDFTISWTGSDLVIHTTP
jgi:hypothetical protein